MPPARLRSFAERARRRGPARGGNDPGWDRKGLSSPRPPWSCTGRRHNTSEKTASGNKKQIEVPGPPLPLRMVATQAVDEAGTVLAEWWLLTNVAGADAGAATIGRWYARRWAIESYHKLIKSSGMNAEAWQQKSCAAFLRRCARRAWPA